MLRRWNLICGKAYEKKVQQSKYYVIGWVAAFIKLGSMHQALPVQIQDLIQSPNRKH